MTRRMSCSMTVEAVRDRTKTVTRRDALTWRNLKAGDRLTLVEKAMGLPKGAKQVVLAEVVVVDVRVEPLAAIADADVPREGVESGSTREQFIRFWLASHGHPQAARLCDDALELLAEGVMCRRIEWRYLDEEATDG